MREAIDRAVSWWYNKPTHKQMRSYLQDARAEAQAQRELVAELQGNLDEARALLDEAKADD